MAKTTRRPKHKDGIHKRDSKAAVGVYLCPSVVCAVSCDGGVTLSLPQSLTPSLPTPPCQQTGKSFLALHGARLGPEHGDWAEAGVGAHTHGGQCSPAVAWDPWPNRPLPP
jgi:hypothetical protein